MHVRERRFTRHDQAIDVAYSGQIGEHGNVVVRSSGIHWACTVLRRRRRYEVVLPPQVGVLKSVVHCGQEFWWRELVNVKWVARGVYAWVWRRDEDDSAGSEDSAEFVKATKGILNVLDRFKARDHLEPLFRVGEISQVTANEGPGRTAHAGLTYR